MLGLVKEVGKGKVGWKGEGRGSGKSFLNAVR